MDTKTKATIQHNGYCYELEFKVTDDSEVEYVEFTPDATIAEVVALLKAETGFSDDEIMIAKGVRT